MDRRFGFGSLYFVMYLVRDFGIIGLFSSISCYCQIRISRFFGFSSSRVTVIARILKKFMFLWKWFGGTGNFLDTLVGFLIWENWEFKILDGLARIFLIAVGFLIWNWIFFHGRKRLVFVFGCFTLWKALFIGFLFLLFVGVYSMEIKTARRGPQGKESSVFDRLGAGWGGH